MFARCNQCNENVKITCIRSHIKACDKQMEIKKQIEAAALADVIFKKHRFELTGRDVEYTHRTLTESIKKCIMDMNISDENLHNIGLFLRTVKSIGIKMFAEFISASKEEQKILEDINISPECENNRMEIITMLMWKFNVNVKDDIIILKEIFKNKLFI